MLKKKIAYTDFNGEQRTEEFTFNLSRLDLMKMNDAYSSRGGLADAFNKAMNNNDEQTAINIFIDLILRSYGEKSEDGRYFNKSEEISERFSKTEAFNVLFDELTTDSNAATSFFYGVIPSNLQNGINPPAA